MKTPIQTHATKNDIPEDVRKKLGVLLNQQVANTVDLVSQAKHAHWNVRGPLFYQVHQLFDQVAEMVEEHIDDIAERASALGLFVHGTIRMASAASELKEFPSKIISDGECVAALAEAFATAANSARAAMNEADELGDMDTADLLTDVSRDLDKALWFLESSSMR